jgi:hypothetical protein
VPSNASPTVTCRVYPASAFTTASAILVRSAARERPLKGERRARLLFKANAHRSAKFPWAALCLAAPGPAEVGECSAVRSDRDRGRAERNRCALPLDASLAPSTADGLNLRRCLHLRDLGGRRIELHAVDGLIGSLRGGDRATEAGVGVVRECGEAW